MYLGIQGRQEERYERDSLVIDCFTYGLYRLYHLSRRARVAGRAEQLKLRNIALNKLFFPFVNSLNVYSGIAHGLSTTQLLF
jgi:hypothetical protein